MSVQTRSCITIYCDSCGLAYENPDVDVAYHFNNIKEAQESIGPGLDITEDQFVINDDGSALCDNCRRQRICSTRGHRWETWPRCALADGLVLPSFVCCQICAAPPGLESPIREDEEKGGGS